MVTCHIVYRKFIVNIWSLSSHLTLRFPKSTDVHIWNFQAGIYREQRSFTKSWKKLHSQCFTHPHILPSLSHHSFSNTNVMTILNDPYTFILNREQISRERNKEKDVSDRGNMKHKIPHSVYRITIIASRRSTSWGLSKEGASSWLSITCHVIKSAN